MAIVITPLQNTPGLAGSRPPLWMSGRQRKVKSFSVALDNSYPTGGEDISSMWAGFNSVTEAFATDPSGARIVTVDIANKKLKVFTALTTEAGNTTDQSTINAVRVLLIGY